MAIRLRGGFETSDQRLDRLPSFDERSRDFPVTAHQRFAPVLKTRNWRLPVRLNQRKEGGCAGWSRTHDLAASPAPAPRHEMTDTFAHGLYRLAQKIDEWPGENYEGTSVLAAVKAAQQLGYVGVYRWAFGIDDVLYALSTVGPVVFGTGWPEAAFEPRLDGTLDFTGSDAGGHAYLGRSVLVPRAGYVRTIRRFDRRGRSLKLKTSEPLIAVPNTWGPEWGVLGEGFIKASELEAKLKDQGEACVASTPFRKVA